MDIKKLFRSIGRDTLMLLVLGGMLIYLSAEDFVVSFKPAVSFQDMLEGTKVKEGSHVAGDVVYSWVTLLRKLHIPSTRTDPAAAIGRMEIIT